MNYLLNLYLKTWMVYWIGAIIIRGQHRKQESRHWQRYDISSMLIILIKQLKSELSVFLTTSSQHRRREWRKLISQITDTTSQFIMETQHDQKEWSTNMLCISVKMVISESFLNLREDNCHPHDGTMLPYQKNPLPSTCSYKFR